MRGLPSGLAAPTPFCNGSLYIIFPSGDVTSSGIKVTGRGHWGARLFAQ